MTTRLRWRRGLRFKGKGVVGGVRKFDGQCRGSAVCQSVDVVKLMQ